MKTIRRLILLTLVTMLLASCTSKARVGSSNGISFKNFAKIDDGSLTLPQFPYETWTLDNGLKVYFVQDTELPLVSSALLIPGGSFWEQDNQRGLYQALGDNMRMGGTTSLNPEALDRELEKYAASISSNFGQEYGAISASSLSTDFEKIFSLMSDVLLRPGFDRQRLSMWKGKALEGIRRRADDPSTVASLSMRKMLVGGTPYGGTTISDDITGITRIKLRNLHSSAVIPNNAILGISGNITRAQAEQVVQKYLGPWLKSSSPLSPPPLYPEQKNKAQIVFVEQPLSQASVLIGQLGPPRMAPDQFTFELFNQYFGSGGFGSVLMKRIRSELGLAYGVYGSIIPGFGKGRALISLQTKTESSGEAIAESLTSLKVMQTKNVLESDLIETRNGIINTFVFNFTSPAQVLGRKMQMDLLGYPTDYDQTYLDNIRAVSSENVRQVANDRWKFEDLVIVLVGPKKALESLHAVQARLPEPLNSAPTLYGRFDEVLTLK